VADVNGDGKPDLIVANSCDGRGFCGNGSVGVLLGNGDGTFRAAVAYSADGFADSIAIADVNGDGKLDLLLADFQGNNSTSGRVGVLLGNGDGSFQAAMAYGSGGANTVSIAIGDVDGDGKVDLLVANNDCISLDTCGHGSVGVLLGNGDGTFQTAAAYKLDGAIPSSVAVADVNGDGKPDLVVAFGCGNSTSCASGEALGGVDVLLNNAAFCTTPTVITLSTTPTSLWPPNGKMVPVTVSGTITDTGCTVTTAVYAVKDEYGEMQPSGPITLGDRGAYSFTVLLQASRLGNDLDGRLYTVTVSASNNAGKTGSQASAVIVPHDEGH